ncbi:MFS transporter [Entomobacter blattae]|uniref:Putative MFS-type transporter YhhS n=1 Tax=Entomobacter blattae TaxID=2762277 RepID=A0A7H1NTK6_9PROT|nr:MFS transporter [Entomobacter blattae]QNT79116.1 putative MFS-type transporter YhhS [Entomobacter blattae]
MALPWYRLSVSGNITLRILYGVIYNFIAYVSVGFGTVVVTLFVHEGLGYKVAVATAVYAIQYLATAIAQPTAGWVCDHIGAKRSVVMGMAANFFYGVLLICVGVFSSHAELALTILIVARVLQGLSEGWSTTGTIIWNIATVGAQHTARAISWNGITTYGGIALGGYLATFLYPAWGILGVGVIIVAISAVGLWIALLRPHIAPPSLREGSKRLKISQILERIYLHGTSLALGSIGFGIIMTFTALYFGAIQWGPYAGQAIASFGIVFVLVRLFFGQMIDRKGGFSIAFISFAVETVGVLVYWAAPVPLVAILGCALIGGGFSLVYPALGVELTKIVGAENRGSAIGFYSLFLDFSMITLAFLGIAQDYIGYSGIFLTGVILTALGGIVAYGAMRVQYHRYPETKR